MKNKRGSHIDVIISFIVFIGIIIFLYAVIQPKIATQQNKIQMIDYAEAQILNNVSGNLTSIPVSIKGISGSCFIFTGFIANVSVTSPHFLAGSEGSTYVTNYSGEDLYVSGTSLPAYIIVGNSEDFPATDSSPPGGCQALQYGAASNGYSLGEVRTDNYAFSSNLNSLISYCDSNYNSLKQQFAIPSGVEFGFGFTYQNKTSIGTTDKSPSTNIYLQSFPIQYVNENGSIQSGNLVVRVW